MKQGCVPWQLITPPVPFTFLLFCFLLMTCTYHSSAHDESEVLSCLCCLVLVPNHRFQLVVATCPVSLCYCLQCFALLLVQLSEPAGWTSTRVKSRFCYMLCGLTEMTIKLKGYNFVPMVTWRNFVLYIQISAPLHSDNWTSTCTHSFLSVQLTVECHWLHYARIVQWVHMQHTK